jgi:hypothetical protein
LFLLLIVPKNTSPQSGSPKMQLVQQNHNLRTVNGQVFSPFQGGRRLNYIVSYAVPPYRNQTHRLSKFHRTEAYSLAVYPQY